jgi:SAM-dependent methyltransferase
MFGLLRSVLADIRSFSDKRKNGDIRCPVCGAMASYLDTVDLNKSCEEIRGLHLPSLGYGIDYHLCDSCGFCFSPEIRTWGFEEFEQRIYNDGYEQVDPDYKYDRPMNNAKSIEQAFGKSRQSISHLDYGGGSGLLSATLRESGWMSKSFDPFVDRNLSVDELGKFDLITAFEVFEHVPDIDQLMGDLEMLCKPNGLILFSTLLSDGNISRSRKLDWWYASPRNGHISLFSQKSLAIALAKKELQLASFSSGMHAAFWGVPDWARSVIRSS